MSSWIFLSKNGQDEYINMLAISSGRSATNTDDFRYEDSRSPIVLRGILKHKIMHRCWQDRRDFYYMDTGYFGNTVSAANPHGWKFWHRIVKNDLQHREIRTRAADRLAKLDLRFHPRRRGTKILIAAPDEKPCRFYGIDRDAWLAQTIADIQARTDRPVVVRERVANRRQRMQQDPLSAVLQNDVHALVTFNSNSAIEAVMQGVPAFVLAPAHAASPVANRDLSRIEDPFWPDQDLVHAWACHLAYGQYHVTELRNGTAYRMLNES
jgi:hypothetical protein